MVPDERLDTVDSDGCPELSVKQEPSSPIVVKDEEEQLEQIIDEPEVILSSSEDSADVDLGSSAEEDGEYEVPQRPMQSRRVSQFKASSVGQVWFAHRKSGEALFHLWSNCECQLRTND